MFGFPLYLRQARWEVDGVETDIEKLFSHVPMLLGNIDVFRLVWSDHVKGKKVTAVNGLHVIFADDKLTAHHSFFRINRDKKLTIEHYVPPPAETKEEEPVKSNAPALTWVKSDYDAPREHSPQAQHHLHQVTAGFINVRIYTRYGYPYTAQVTSGPALLEVEAGSLTFTKKAALQAAIRTAEWHVQAYKKLLDEMEAGEILNDAT